MNKTDTVLSLQSMSQWLKEQLTHFFNRKTACLLLRHCRPAEKASTSPSVTGIVFILEMVKFS